METKLSNSNQVATIFLDPTRKLDEVCKELEASFAKALENQLRAIVLSDSDNQEFGLNISPSSDSSKLETLTHQIRHLPIPVIASVKNNVSSSGFEIVRASHICIASESSTFDSKSSKAEDYSAREVLDQGLINRVVKSELVKPETDKFIAQMLELAPIAIASCLKAVNSGLESNLRDGLAVETKLFCKIFATQDMKEGTSAFLEKRKPNFVGK